MSKKMQFRIVLVTCGSVAEARRIARAVVEKRLAACVNVLGGPVESIYRWKGQVEEARERLLVMKTEVKKVKSLQSAVFKMHSYETPEFLVLEVVGGSAAYLGWLAGSLNGK